MLLRRHHNLINKGPRLLQRAMNQRAMHRPMKRNLSTPTLLNISHFSQSTRSLHHSNIIRVLANPRNISRSNVLTRINRRPRLSLTMVHYRRTIMAHSRSRDNTSLPSLYNPRKCILRIQVHTKRATDNHSSLTMNNISTTILINRQGRPNSHLPRFTLITPRRRAFRRQVLNLNRRNHRNININNMPNLSPLNLKRSPFNRRSLLRLLQKTRIRLTANRTVYLLHSLTSLDIRHITRHLRPLRIRNSSHMLRISRSQLRKRFRIIRRHRPLQPRLFRRSAIRLPSHNNTIYRFLRKHILRAIRNRLVNTTILSRIPIRRTNTRINRNRKTLPKRRRVNLRYNIPSSAIRFPLLATHNRR